MNDDSEKRLTGQQTEYRSPSLSVIPLKEIPYTLCASCPLSRWYKRGGWNCFCSEFRTLTLDETVKATAPVYACDARELEIIKMNAEREG